MLLFSLSEYAKRSAETKNGHPPRETKTGSGRSYMHILRGIHFISQSKIAYGTSTVAHQMYVKAMVCA